MTKEELKARFDECLAYSDNNEIRLSIVGCEVLLRWFREALYLKNEKLYAGKKNDMYIMYHRLYGIIGYLADMNQIDFEQNEKLTELAVELCCL